MAATTAAGKAGNSDQHAVTTCRNAQGRSLESVLSPVVDWLKARGFLSDSKAYRFLLPALNRAGRSEAIRSSVNARFVLESVLNGQQPELTHGERLPRRNPRKKDQCGIHGRPVGGSGIRGAHSRILRDELSLARVRTEACAVTRRLQRWCRQLAPPSSIRSPEVRAVGSLQEEHVGIEAPFTLYRAGRARQ